jgi:sugar lactone lactonase YvrE
MPVGRLALETAIGYTGGIAFDREGRLFLSLTTFQAVFQVSSGGRLQAVAGNGIRGYSGDRGAAASASLSIPSGLTFAGDGSLYVADVLNHCIRKVSPNGTIATVAGTGIAGYSGDGGPATVAALDTPDDVVVDAAGNLFISDTGNNRVRKVAANGVISTYAGDGRPRFGGDGGPAPSATVDQRNAAGGAGGVRPYRQHAIPIGGAPREPVLAA